jgi:5-methylcytosine-specific restriction endonuclease McrA
VGKRTVECERCGAEIERWPSHVSDPNYCSVKCRQQRDDRLSSEDHGQYNSVEIGCDWCGAELERPDTASRSTTTTSATASVRQRGGTATPTAARATRSTRITVVCDQCGAALERIPAHVKRGEHNFCDDECRREWTSENIRGPDHPMWEGGRVRKYGRHWDRVREVVIERDGTQCWFCGRSRAANRAIHDRDLAVYHTRPFVEFDSYEQAHELQWLLGSGDLSHNDCALCCSVTTIRRSYRNQAVTQTGL